MSRVTFPIHHTFGPLVTPDQWRLAFRLQFQPGRWRDGEEREMLRSGLSHSFGMSVSLFATAREALLATLRALGLKPGDEVILQGFTCVAVPNAIHAAEGTAVYSDIDPQTLDLDLNKLQRAITSRTKAVICQHTFGIPADTEKLRAICDRRNLLLIEDCAHVMPDTGSAMQLSLLQAPSSAEGVGVHGDVLLFSFGRDKAVSGVTGGAVLTRHRALAQALARMEEDADALSPWQILNLIGYPLRYHFAKILWSLPGGSNAARGYLRWVQILKLLPPVYGKGEKEGKAGVLLFRLPNACAALALQQIGNLGRFNAHRRHLASLYAKAAGDGNWDFPSGALKSPAPLRFPVFARNADALRRELKREQVHLDDGWCGAVVNPRSVDPAVAGYAAGSCPVAEEVARHIVSLPTHPTMSEAQARYLIHALRSYLG